MRVMSPSRHKGATEQASYLGWLRFFSALADSPERIRVENFPRCWIPMIRYMGHVYSSPQSWFYEDGFEFPQTFNDEHVRRVVEVASSCRPELAHALRLWDTSWKNRAASKARLAGAFPRLASEYVIANEAGLNRIPLQFERLRLDGVRSVVVIPAHEDSSNLVPKVLKAFPERYQPIVLIASSAFGVMPYLSWLAMPKIHCGVIDHWRLFQTSLKIFDTEEFRLTDVYVYCDRASEAICAALRIKQISFCNFEFDLVDGYADLSSEENLRRLESATS